MKIFISHSSKEADVANELCAGIESRGNQCFIAPRDIRSGFPYAEEIANGIDSSDAVLLVLSNEANRSPHVLREVERAVTKNIPILVYTLEEVQLTKSMEYFLMTHQWMFAGRDSYEDVINSVENIKDSSATPVAPATMGNAFPKKKSGKKLGFIIGGIVAAVAILAIAIVAVIGLQDKSPKDDGNGDIVSNENATTKENSSSQSATKEQTTQGPTANEDEDGIQLGDTVVMGKYNGEEIYWNVIKISEDGKSAVVVARDVLTVKAYDAAESGRYNYKDNVSYYSSDSEAETDMELQAFVRGDSSWINSNIRTWLNSDKINVVYEGQVPASSAMADGKNGYNNEAGFLKSFNEEELNAILVTTVETKENALNEGGIMITEDKVFLLSKDELEWFKQADVSLLAKPTASAISKNETFWYKDYCLDFGVETMMWWLREPVLTSSSKCYLVGNGYYENNIYEWEVGVESFGIRPAMTIDLTAQCIKEVK